MNHKIDEEHGCTTIQAEIEVQRPTYISVDEMAKMLSIARATAYQLTKIIGFPCFYIGKRIIIPLDTFSEWANRQAADKAAFFER